MAAGNIFSDDSFLDNLFDAPAGAPEKAPEETAPRTKTGPDESTLIYDKSCDCPVCYQKFTYKVVKSGKAAFKGYDKDLRPHYDGIDGIKYEVMLCPTCGYAVLQRHQRSLLKSEKEALLAKVKPAFRMRLPEEAVYSYETARERFKVALINAAVRNAKNGEKADICLRTAYLLRGEREELETAGTDNPAQLLALEEEEKGYLERALQGFTLARASEDLPIAGMDANTLDYLLAALHFELGQYEEAARFVSGVLTSRTAKKTLHTMAENLKEEIMLAKQEGKG